MLKRKKERWQGVFLTESFLQGLYVATLRTALPSLLVIGTVVSQAGAGAAAGSNAVALEFALPANHAGKALGLGDAGVVRVRIARRHVVVLRRAVARVVPAVARRAVVRGAGHGCWLGDGDCARSAAIKACGDDDSWIDGWCLFLPPGWISQFLQRKSPPRWANG